MILAGFEPAIPASKRSQTHALDRAATGIGMRYINYYNIIKFTYQVTPITSRGLLKL